MKKTRSVTALSLIMNNRNKKIKIKILRNTSCIVIYALRTKDKSARHGGGVALFPVCPNIFRTTDHFTRTYLKVILLEFEQYGH